MKEDDVHRVRHIRMRMIKQMCCASLKNKHGIIDGELREMIGVKSGDEER